MRPDLLNPLFASVRGLNAVGPKRAKLIGKLTDTPAATGEARLIDLLWHLPATAIDRRKRPPLNQIRVGDIVTVKVTVGDHVPARTPGRPYRVRCYDDDGLLDIVFFNAQQAYLEKLLPPGEVRYVSGLVGEFNGRWQIVHPDHVVDEAHLASLPLIEPVYPLTAGLTRAVMAKAQQDALSRLPAMPEWLDADLLRQKSWPDIAGALQAIHQPQRPDDILPSAPAYQRLAYDELLAGQLALGLVRAQMKRHAGRSLRGTGEVTARIRDALPFSLTASQQQAVAEIAADLAAPERMVRLVQGDVGSGKTVVALLAMAIVVEAGKQAALMAPTEVLARQHFKTIAPLCDAAGLSCVLLTGREKGRARAEILAGLADGSTNIVIGTHALFQDDVTFHDLALAVVDEQHRFGVHQRLALTEKSDHGVDLLVMTATPIPRTLVLSYFGDMDSSRLTEKPAGRQPIETRAMPLERIDEIVAHLQRAIGQGARAYWICPLVEESEQLDITPAETRFKTLQSAFGARVGLVHGRMSGKEKDAAMADFASGATSLLVATTVVEVGVDVPEATIIVIEHAERFGLAQLHQLRGRVGRGAAKSSCLLLYKAPLGETAKARLTILRETDDGFRIAEEDLRLRGEGEILGTRQSGSPGFHIARLEVHGDLLQTARKDAQLQLTRDPRLLSERGQALRVLLYLFERDEAIRLIAAG